MPKHDDDWMFYLSPEMWQSYKLRDLHDEVHKGRLEAATAHRRADDSLYTIEENVARGLLLLHSLVETLVRKGLVTREEISAVFQELDMLDGQADGKLPSGTLPGTVKPPQKAPSTRDYLRQLEQGNG